MTEARPGAISFAMSTDAEALESLPRPEVPRRAWVLIVALATVIAAYALAALILPTLGAPLVAQRRATMPWSMQAHLAGGALALALGAWQLNGRLRVRHPAWHRWVGRSYLAAVGIGGASGLALATRSDEGIVTHLGFGALAVAWLITTGVAFAHIRRREVASHRRWMVRSFALTFAAVTLRTYLPLSFAFGVPFPTAYRVISWACWIPNLLFAEWWLRRGSSR